MGCGVSRLDDNDVAFPARLRLPFLQRLEEIPGRRHNGPIKEPTPSKKELLSHHMYDDYNLSHHHSPNGSKTAPSSPTMARDMKHEETKVNRAHNPKEESSYKENGIVTSMGNQDDKTKGDVAKEESSKVKGKNDMKECMVEDDKAKIGEFFTDGDDEDENDDERMIGHESDYYSQGSPSFRIYYKDNGEDDHNDDGKNNTFKDTIVNDDASSKESSAEKKVNKRGKTIMNFKNVFPKGGQVVVKNLLNVKSYYKYTSCRSFHNHSTRLLSGKTKA